MIVWFWDADWNEHCGVLALPAAPEIGQTVVSGFVRYRPETAWRVIGRKDDYVLLSRKDLDGWQSGNAPGC